jgi:hypothetical protein
MADNKHDTLNVAKQADPADSNHDVKDAIVAETGEILPAIDPKAERR